VGFVIRGLRKKIREGLSGHLLLAAMGIALFASASDAKTPKPEKVTSPPDKEVVDVRFDDDNEPVESDAPGINQIFKNPALASGLASSADAINRSIESLMESLFYSLMDNELKYPTTEHSWMSLGVKRDVYSADKGAYVIVDRVGLGPRYSKELWNVQKVPIVLGAEGTVEVLDIYLRTDGQRVAEQTDLPFWRQAVNNWFGLLPLLSTVMPPSFNQNELYDPLSLGEVPFVLPLSIEAFKAMPIGSIRSYNVSGGVHLALSLDSLADQKFRNVLEKAEGLLPGLPYTVFKQGQHSINVLRRNDHIAWVGLRDSQRLGHSIDPLIGKTLFVFTGVIPYWRGLALNTFPVDVKIEFATSERFDQLYEYDLRKTEAQKAYLSAVRGEFTESYKAYIEEREGRQVTGVRFHFTRSQNQIEDVTRNSRNFAVERQSRTQERTRAEVEIKDQQGLFHILDARQETEDTHWDVLVGSEELKYRNLAELKVVKVARPEEPRFGNQHTYVFAVDKDPIRMTSTMVIQDRYADAEELEGYLDALRFFTSMPLDDIAPIEAREPDEEVFRRRSAFFDDPKSSLKRLHVTPTYLGRFSADASVSFSTEALSRIGAKPLDLLWEKFAEAFGVDTRKWNTEAGRESFATQGQWLLAAAAYPLRLFNLRSSTVDAVHESDRAIKALRKMHEAQTPLEKQDSFFALFDSDHPQFLTKALLNLSDLDLVPRIVTLSTSPKGGGNPGPKARFKALNGKVFKSAAPFPASERYRIAEEQLAAFYPGNLRELRRKPVVVELRMETRRLPPGALARSGKLPQGIDPRKKHLYLRLAVRNMDLDKNGRVFLRFEQSGKIQFAKLALAEKVVELAPIPSGESGPANLDRQGFETFLTGPLSPLASFVFDQAVDIGGEFRLLVSVSQDGTIWSDEKPVKFRFENGRLAPQ